MVKYLITLFNGAMVKIDTEVIEAKDGNDAIKKYLDLTPIYEGDTLKIEEYENE